MMNESFRLTAIIDAKNAESALEKMRSNTFTDYKIERVYRVERGVGKPLEVEIYKDEDDNPVYDKPDCETVDYMMTRCNNKDNDYVSLYVQIPHEKYDDAKTTEKHLVELVEQQHIPHEIIGERESGNHEQEETRERKTRTDLYFFHTRNQRLYTRHSTGKRTNYHGIFYRPCRRRKKAWRARNLRASTVIH